MLAFIGGLASKGLIRDRQFAPIADSLVLFAFGVVAAVASMGLSYVVHHLTGHALELNGEGVGASLGETREEDEVF